MITACRFFNKDGSLGERFFVPAVIPAYLPVESPNLDDTQETMTLLSSLETLLSEWEEPIRQEWTNAM